MQQQKRATISIFQGSMVAWCWLQNCTEVSKFTEHLEPHTASDGTLYSSLVFSDSVCLQNCVFSPPPLSLLLSWAGLQCFHLVIIRFKGTLLFLHHFSGLPYFLYMWTTLMCLSRVLFMDAAAIFFVQICSHWNVTEKLRIKSKILICI